MVENQEELKQEFEEWWMKVDGDVVCKKFSCFTTTEKEKCKILFWDAFIVGAKAAARKMMKSVLEK